MATSRLIHHLFPFSCRNSRQELGSFRFPLPPRVRHGASRAGSRLLPLLLAACSLTACKRGGRSLTDIFAKETTDSEVSVMEQARPKIMVIPSDRLLKELQCVTPTDDGTALVRDYPRFLLNCQDYVGIVRKVQAYFIERDYPLNDLEQTVKSLNDRQLVDEADAVAKDAKTLLLATARPDIILELDCAIHKKVGRSRINKTQDLLINAIDAYSNKVVATLAIPEFTGKKNNVGKGAEALEKSDELENMDAQLRKYFEDLVKNGREITFRVTIDEQSPINLTDSYNSAGDTYADWIRRWVITRAKKGTATMQLNTAKEMTFDNVRITNQANDGTQYTAYEFMADFRRDFRQSFGLTVLNTTQGLGDASAKIK